MKKKSELDKLERNIDIMFACGVISISTSIVVWIWVILV